MCEIGDLDDLLADAPLGDYLFEHRGRVRFLWRITDGEPPDGALEPVEAWAMQPVAKVLEPA
jgi:hypothetical protein